MTTSTLITGGGSGIGAALARTLASRGCRVLISGRRSESLEGVAESSELISTLAGDVTDPAHRDALVTALAELPGPRSVVHGAGSFQNGLLETLPHDDWRRSFEVNVEARWRLSVGCAPLLDGGRVLFIGSDAGVNPRAGAAAYSVAQAASETLRRALQAEWADSGRFVGAFKPGLVDTDMVRSFLQLPLEEFPARSAYEQYVARGRVSTVDTVARFASWLLLEVGNERFVDTDWDIRDVVHHDEWLEGPLYPTAT